MSAESELSFVSIDVETANPNMASICQVGIAVYEGGRLVDEWQSLVNPDDYFDDMNVSIHGINGADIDDSPLFIDVASQVFRLLDGKVVVSHTGFDRTAVHRAFEAAGVREPAAYWLDSARVVRRVWPQFSRKGYGLSSVAGFLGFDFRHHDALEDAKAAARILIAASQEVCVSLDGLKSLVSQPITVPTGDAIKLLHANPNGSLFGEILVFTGSLMVSRKDAAGLAAEAGCTVGTGVTKKTTLLVVGDQDISKLAGKSKSSKHVKAEKLMVAGQSIRIVGESDFMVMLKMV